MSSSAAKSEAHIKAARARWGPRRILRLDQLDPDERRLVDALLTAKRNADSARAREEAATETTVTAQEDGDASAHPRQRAA